MPHPAPMSAAARRAAAALLAAATLLPLSSALACDGKSYSLNAAPGASVEGGGLVVRLDKAKFIDNVPDKYYISVKDDGQVLADHILLEQYDTVNFKTRCGTVSIGADRKHFFGNGQLNINWSYF